MHVAKEKKTMRQKRKLRRQDHSSYGALIEGSRARLMRQSEMIEMYERRESENNKDIEAEFYDTTKVILQN